ncbi:collagen alpha-1(I) chain-like [Hippopotamus amphibius kiboko]|uniref:collagen alpha-1(I) chain-like n=1 Tax=Hippopotamus amphibius kiboko TaxID=575201 RepID=UPI00259A8C98|nr:collagen alpha-1(I) chain-like [Hippopotamus amphibius kiboko]
MTDVPSQLSSRRPGPPEPPGSGQGPLGPEDPLLAQPRPQLSLGPPSPPPAGPAVRPPRLQSPSLPRNSKSGRGGGPWVRTCDPTARGTGRAPPRRLAAVAGTAPAGPLPAVLGAHAPARGGGGGRRRGQRQAEAGPKATRSSARCRPPSPQRPDYRDTDPQPAPPAPHRAPAAPPPPGRAPARARARRGLSRPLAGQRRGGPAAGAGFGQRGPEGAPGSPGRARAGRAEARLVRASWAPARTRAGGRGGPRPGSRAGPPSRAQTAVAAVPLICATLCEVGTRVPDAKIEAQLGFAPKTQTPPPTHVEAWGPPPPPRESSFPRQTAEGAEGAEGAEEVAEPSALTHAPGIPGAAGGLGDPSALGRPQPAGARGGRLPDGAGRARTSSSRSRPAGFLQVLQPGRHLVPPACGHHSLPALTREVAWCPRPDPRPGAEASEEPGWTGSLTIHFPFHTCWQLLGDRLPPQQASGLAPTGRESGGQFSSSPTIREQTLPGASGAAAGTGEAAFLPASKSPQAEGEQEMQAPPLPRPVEPTGAPRRPSREGGGVKATAGAARAKEKGVKEGSTEEGGGRSASKPRAWLAGNLLRRSLSCPPDVCTPTPPGQTRPGQGLPETCVPFPNRAPPSGDTERGRARPGPQGLHGGAEEEEASCDPSSQGRFLEVGARHGPSGAGTHSSQGEKMERGGARGESGDFREAAHRIPAPRQGRARAADACAPVGHVAGAEEGRGDGLPTPQHLAGRGGAGGGTRRPSARRPRACRGGPGTRPRSSARLGPRPAPRAHSWRGRAPPAGGRRAPPGRALPPRLRAIDSQLLGAHVLLWAGPERPPQPGRGPCSLSPAETPSESQRCCQLASGPSLLPPPPSEAPLPWLLRGPQTSSHLTPEPELDPVSPAVAGKALTKGLLGAGTYTPESYIPTPGTSDSPLSRLYKRNGDVRPQAACVRMVTAALRVAAKICEESTRSSSGELEPGIVEKRLDDWVGREKWKTGLEHGSARGLRGWV